MGKQISKNLPSHFYRANSPDRLFNNLYNDDNGLGRSLLPDIKKRAASIDDDAVLFGCFSML